MPRTKKLSANEKRLAKQVDDLAYQLRVARSDAANEREEKIRVQGELQGLEKTIRRIEGVERNMYQEVKWLRETLRLVIVDKGKIPELHKLIEEERKECDPLEREYLGIRR